MTSALVTPLTLLMASPISSRHHPAATDAGVEPENTAVNRVDMEKNRVTAQDQSNSKPDLEITRLIRRAIVTDKELSVSAHNVKIITSAGNVTLKGPVNSEEEMKNIKSKVVEVAGKDRVSCELTVKP